MSVAGKNNIAHLLVVIICCPYLVPFLGCALLHVVTSGLHTRARARFPMDAGLLITSMTSCTLCSSAAGRGWLELLCSVQPAAVLAGRAPVVRSKMLQGSTPPDDFAKQKSLFFYFFYFLFFYVLYSVTVLRPSTKDASRQGEISRAAAEMSGVT